MPSAAADDRSDNSLVSAHLDGEPTAFEALYRRHRDRVYCLCLGVTTDRELAADITQDIFVKLHGRLGSFHGTAAFTTWLHRVTVNACYDALRRPKASSMAPWDETSPDAFGDPSVPLEPHVTADARLTIAAALRCLPVEQRFVIVLHDLYDYQYHEIADLLDVPIGTVKSRLARGRMRLVQILCPGSTAGNIRSTLARQNDGES